MGFSVPSILNHNATHSPSLARKNKTENDSRLIRNSEGKRRRAGGRHCFILARDKNKKDQKNLRRNLVNYRPKQVYNTFLTINWLTIYFNVQGIVYLFLCALDHIFESREDKADRKGIPHTHPIP